ncbi:hypothetical protein JXA02_09830 [candidate division KSB1 bacterium]|nr:hypothetical protein [candidate division KSB1 bacterium]RQW04035.1 MAG: hypothetical protein EH222_11680 [candidate division KSB1 bacterium]
MKKALLFYFLLGTIAFSEIVEKQTLTKGNARHGGFVAAAITCAEVSDAWYGMYGFRMGWIINRHFSLGAAYFDMAKYLTHYKVYAPDVVQPAQNSHYFLLDTNKAGLELEYFLNPDGQVHISASALMGIGHIKYEEPAYFEVFIDDRHLFIEPTVTVNLNISENVKLNIGFIYRFVSGIRAEGLNNGSLSGFTVSSSLAVGFF